DGEVDVTAADHPEGGGRVEERGTLHRGDRLLAGVDEVGILLTFQRPGPDAEESVLRVEEDVHPGGDVVGDEGGKTDAQVDVPAVLQLEGDAVGDLFASEGHVRWSLRSGALSHGALLDPLLVAGALQHLLDEDAGGVDLVG